MTRRAGARTDAATSSPGGAESGQEETMRFELALLVALLLGVPGSDPGLAQSSCPPEVEQARAMLASAQAQKPSRTTAGARSKEQQASRGQDQQAPRGQDQQAPRGQDQQAPRGQDQQAPRGQDQQAPRGQDQQ